jgi:phage recombination protein Bet
MKKELTTTTTSLEMLQTLRNTVALGLTEPEFMLFAEMCRATGLNPATKEIWAIKAGGRLQLMTGINGFLRIANSHPEFDGMEVAFEWDGKTLVSCTVKVHRKDRKYPSVGTAYMTEYAKQTSIWRTMPTVMLSKCAKSLAIREAFIQELGGLYTAEEMPPEFAPPKAAIEPKTVTVEPVVDDLPEDWFDPKKPSEAATEPSKRVQPTYYDVSKLPEDQRQKGRNYLRDCEAKHICDDIWRAPIRLERLTQCITEDTIHAKN